MNSLPQDTKDFIDNLVKDIKYTSDRINFVLVDKEGKRLKTVYIPKRYVLYKRYDIIFRALEILLDGRTQNLNNFQIIVEDLNQDV